MCKDQVPTQTNAVTWFGNSLRESVELFEQWANPTIDSSCSNFAKFFYCGIFFPVCEERKILPCLAESTVKVISCHLPKFIT